MAMHSCRCCLRRAADKDLATPYTHLGTTEIYTDMLLECFNIHLPLSGHGECGICEVCVGRLRDASDFKLQVQRSQAELQARLQDTTVFVKDENPAIKIEVIDEGITEQCVFTEPCADPLVKSEPPDGAASDEDWSSGPGDRVVPLGDAVVAWEHAAACSKGQGERRMEDVTDDTAGLRAEEQAYTCDTCGEHFTDKSRLIDHVHANCDKKSAPKQNLNTKKTYSCEECNKRFTRQGSLYTHKRSHLGEKPFSCKECGKRFTQKQTLIAHKRIHAGQKPYGCKECDKRFTQKQQLDRHKRIHTGIKPFSCSECNKQFTQKYTLDVHKRTHTGDKPYSCNECDKTFAVKQNLNTHKIIHSSLKPFSCKQCNKQFTQKVHLDKHVRIHTGEKPYSCNECNKQFIQKHHLDTHKRIHSADFYAYLKKQNK